MVLFDSVDKTEWSGVFCLNLSKYKILLQDFPEIIGVILITLNTAFFGFKKFSLTKHNNIRECINKKNKARISYSCEKIEVLSMENFRYIAVFKLAVMTSQRRNWKVLETESLTEWPWIASSSVAFATKKCISTF